MADAGGMPSAGGIQIPRELVDRAAQLLADGGEFQPVVPRPAATVALLRSSGASFEVFLQRRLASMAFAASMHVFPGGVIEHDDLVRARAIDPTTSCDAVSETFGLDCLAARCAAVRETEEESGYDIGDPRSLTYMAHWVTPEVEPRRYDTRFYATTIAGGVPPRMSEADAACWVTPARALQQHADGEIMMLPPTVAVLSQFAELAGQGLGPHEAVAHAGAIPVRPMLPAPRRDRESGEAVAWVIVDARTGEQIVPPIG